MAMNTLLLSLAAVGAPRAYPIPPEPLRILIAEAEFVVTAEVREPDAHEAAVASISAPFETTFVALDIDQILKGTLAVGTIVVVNDLGMICPEPARYAIGTRVLAFLDRTVDGGFTTHALSYGAKTLDDAGLSVYLQRIKEQFAIETMPEGAERLAAQVEWLVTCAEHPGTRWEGAYEFVTDVEARGRRSHTEPTRFARELSNAQCARLRAAYLSAESFDLGAACFEQFFRSDGDPRFLEWQVKRLRRVHQDTERNAYGEAASLVACIGFRDGRSEVRKLAETFASMRPYGERGDDGAGRLRIVRELLTLYP